MPQIAILRDDCRSRAIYLDNSQLPVSYMEDFTLLGFIVQHYEAACTLHRNAGYTVIDRASGGDILIDNARQVRDISNLFLKNDIPANFSDIADTIYQA